MKQFENIPEYSMRIIVFPKLIQCYDLISKEVVCSKNYRSKIANVQKVSFNSFLLFDKNSEIIDAIYIELVSERSKVATGAQYIRDLFMDTSHHGYYFGTYEIGEYTLLKDDILVIDRAFPLKYCSKGCITSENIFYLGIRESKTFSGPHSYYLIKLDWGKNKEPRLLWKKAIPSSIMGISQMENQIYIGLKTGDLQIWDIEKDEFIKEVHIFDNPLSIIELGCENIIATSWKGEIASIMPNGDIEWRTQLSQEKIETIFSDIHWIMVVDIKGNYFQLSPETGSIIERGFWPLISVKDATIASNLISFRDWFVLTGYGGIWAFYNKNYSKIFHHYMEDPLVRRLHPHPLGLFTGDDTGYLRFWKVGGIKSSYQI
ncbi:MAG: hypothetical protein ACFE8E_15430 [Candidatus Hodarchaeota archaeon]